MTNNATLTGSVNQINVLRELGLEQELFTRIGERILTAYSQTTPHDAVGAAGMYAYLAAVRATRDILKTKGWEPCRESNIELVVSQKFNLMIRVSSGDMYTGKEEREVRNTNPKGEQTASLVSRNPTQLELFPIHKKDIESLPTPTWFLFYHIDAKKEEMRMELSLPKSYDKEKRIIYGLIERIFLDPIKFDGNDIVIEDDFAPEFEFEIQRRSNG